MPNAATLASEYVPRKQRPFAVTLTIVCIPLGGVLAGEMAARIIPTTAGGRCSSPAACPARPRRVLWKVLPESPRYLAGRRERWPELTQAVRRIGHDVPDRRRRTSKRGDAPGMPQGKAESIGDAVRAALSPRHAGLFGASFFFCLMVNYVVIQLLPACCAAPAVSRQPQASRGAARCRTSAASPARSSARC